MGANSWILLNLNYKYKIYIKKNSLQFRNSKILIGKRTFKLNRLNDLNFWMFKDYILFFIKQIICQIQSNV